MTAIKAEAELHALGVSSAIESVDDKYQKSTINLSIFRNENILEVTQQPPLKKRKLGWIPAKDETNCDSFTLTHLIIDFVSIEPSHKRLLHHKQLTECRVLQMISLNRLHRRRGR